MTDPRPATREPRVPARRPFLRTPPAWLITVALFVFSAVTIVLAVSGQ